MPVDIDVFVDKQPTTQLQQQRRGVGEEEERKNKPFPALFWTVSAKAKPVYN